MASSGLRMPWIRSVFRRWPNTTQPTGPMPFWIGLPIVTIPSTARAKRKLTISLTPKDKWKPENIYWEKW